MRVKTVEITSFHFRRLLVRVVRSNSGFAHFLFLLLSLLLRCCSPCSWPCTWPAVRLPVQLVAQLVDLDNQRSLWKFRMEAQIIEEVPLDEVETIEQEVTDVDIRDMEDDEYAGIAANDVQPESKMYRSFKCHICKVYFTRLHTLKSHISTNHPELDWNDLYRTTTFKCGEGTCKYIGKTRTDLLGHLYQEHDFLLHKVEGEFISTEDFTVFFEKLQKASPSRRERSTSGIEVRRGAPGRARYSRVFALAFVARSKCCTQHVLYAAFVAILAFIARSVCYHTRIYCPQRSLPHSHSFRVATCSHLHRLRAAGCRKTH